MNAAEAFARLQLEALRDSLDDVERIMRIALEPHSADKLVRMRSELLAAEAGRVLGLARRYAQLALDPRTLDAVRTVEVCMAALARQSTGMWEAHLRAARQAIEQAIEAA